jgi:hypothetical protein
VSSRYVYADYTFGKALQHAINEGVPAAGLHYDIMCHYIKNMWKRFAEFRPPLAPITASNFKSFLAAVPKFHLAGHTEGCFACFSLNYMSGVGRLDGEGGEHCWANLNHTAGSTSEKGPGARIDSLSHVMHQWNWTRIVHMRRCSTHPNCPSLIGLHPADLLVQKYVEAVQLAEQHQLAFADLDESIASVVRIRWQSMDTNCYTSCFRVLPKA